MSFAEAEALMLFLAERSELWARHSVDCGVEDPDELPRNLATAHATAAGKGAKML